MDRQKFIEHFRLLLVHLKDFTNDLCFNEISENYKFIIEPSSREFSEHLKENEKQYLKTFNKLKDKTLLFDEVVNLLFKNNQTPKWVDSSIYFSASSFTIVHLFFRREFVDENQVYYLDRGTGPFKAVVLNPPDSRKKVIGNKFDVNSQKI